MSVKLASTGDMDQDEELIVSNGFDIAIFKSLYGKNIVQINNCGNSIDIQSECSSVFEAKRDAFQRLFDLMESEG